MIAAGTAPRPALVDLRELLEIHDGFTERAARKADEAVDLSQFLKALDTDRLANRTWTRLHAFATGVAACYGVDAYDVIVAARRLDK